MFRKQTIWKGEILLFMCLVTLINQTFALNDNDGVCVQVICRDKTYFNDQNESLIIQNVQSPFVTRIVSVNTQSKCKTAIFHQLSVAMTSQAPLLKLECPEIFGNHFKKEVDNAQENDGSSLLNKQQKKKISHENIIQIQEDSQHNLLRFKQESQDIAVCQKSTDCDSNLFCWNTKCINLMSLKGGEQLLEMENYMFRIGDSLIDLRCESLLVALGRCVSMELNSKMYQIQRCNHSSDCSVDRTCQCTHISMRSSNSSSSFCQLLPNHISFRSALHTEFLERFFENNRKCSIQQKFTDNCKSIQKDLMILRSLVIYIDNYHLAQTCIKQQLLDNQNIKEAIEFFDNYLSKQFQFKSEDTFASSVNRVINRIMTADDEKKGSDEDSGSMRSVWIIILVVFFLLIGCCGGFIYIRRRNSNGFASLTANLEQDKQLMIKGGGPMSMGSSSNSSTGNRNGSAPSNEKAGAQKQQNRGPEVVQMVEVTKFSKRIPNENVLMQAHLNEGSQPLKMLENNSRGELHLEQNNDFSESNSKNTIQSKINPKSVMNTIITANNINTANPCAEQNEQKEELNQVHDTSVHNNFFSIDGDDEEKQDKIMDSLQLEYQSDDTTYSNVFNLEGEESSKPTSLRKKKKKKNKQQNHLFFEDKDQES